MPRIVDHDVRRATFSQAAGQLIARGGVAAASVREIAREAGVSPSLVAHYFQDSDEILLEAYRWANQRATRRFRKKIAGDFGVKLLTRALEEALPLSAESALEWQVRVAFWGHREDLPRIAREEKKSSDAFLSTLEGFFRRARKDGEIRKSVSPSRAAHELSALLIGLSLSHLTNPEGFTPRKVRSLFRDHFRNLA